MTRLQGTLVFDSTETEAGVGARGVATETRTLIYRSGPYNLDLLVHPGPDDGSFVHGQLTRGLVAEPVADAVMSIGEDGETTQPDELGQFALSVWGRPDAQKLIIVSATLQIVCALPILN